MLTQFIMIKFYVAHRSFVSEQMTYRINVFILDKIVVLGYAMHCSTNVIQKRCDLNVCIQAFIILDVMDFRPAKCRTVAFEYSVSI